MSRDGGRTLLVLAAVLFSSCGYIGSPLPPLANVPERVVDLAAVQRAARIIVHFNLPTRTTENTLIKTPLEVDLRIGTAAVTPFRAEVWAEQATKVPQVPPTKGLATYDIPSTAWTGKDVTLAVRVIAENGKHSDWSNFVSLPIVPPPPTPGNPMAVATAEGVRLTWTGPPGEFRVFRGAADGTNFVRLDDTTQTAYTDHAAEFGTAYSYLVQRVVKLGDNKEAESDTTKEITILPVDTFPPAVPAGLRASAAPASMELSWDRDIEPDLAGYRIYRAAPGGAFEKIAEVTQIPSYSDHAVERGRTYRYAVSAFDQSGNESQKSTAVEAALL